jgi:signal transduction histidine kinase
VLLNLLLNSAQAIGENGTITIEVARDGASAVLRVDDTGTGFGAAALKGAFQPFYTTKEQGSGLGLSVAKRIVEGHGGSITLGNRPEGGARVSLEIPLDPGARSAEEA